MAGARCQDSERHYEADSHSESPLLEHSSTAASVQGIGRRSSSAAAVLLFDPESTSTCSLASTVASCLAKPAGGDCLNHSANCCSVPPSHAAACNRCCVRCCIMPPATTTPRSKVAGPPPMVKWPELDGRLDGRLGHRVTSSSAGISLLLERPIGHPACRRTCSEKGLHKRGGVAVLR